MNDDKKIFEKKDISDKKRALRKFFKERRNAIGDGRGEKALAAVCSFLEYKNAKTVFCYVSMGSEISTKELFKKVLADGKTLLVPKIVSKTEGKMQAVRIFGFDDLASGEFGIYEPKQSLESFCGKIDLTVVPGLAFSPNGVRLGYGGGYYDRFLAKNKTFSIGLCHKELLTDNLPKDGFDVLCSKVIAI